MSIRIRIDSDQVHIDAEVSESLMASLAFTLAKLKDSAISTLLALVSSQTKEPTRVGQTDKPPAS